MTQQRILELLIEAAQSSCDPIRINAIQVEFKQAAVQKREYPEQAWGIQVVLDNLYVDTIRQDRSRLPELLPAFALICGIRSRGTCISPIDWSAIPKPSTNPIRSR